MKRPSVTPRAMEEHIKLKRRHSMELVTRTDASEELEVLISQKGDQSKPNTPAIHLNVKGESDRNYASISQALRVALLLSENPSATGILPGVSASEVYGVTVEEPTLCLQAAQRLRQRQCLSLHTHHFFKYSQSGSE